LLHLLSQCLHLCVQFLEAFDETVLGLAGGFETAPFTAVCHELAAIQVQRLDVKSSCLAESLQRAILLIDEMGRQIIPERVQDAVRRVGLPAAPLEFIAGMATVHPVFWLIQAALGTGLEVVNGEFRSYVMIADPAVTATGLKTLPKCFSLVLSHRLLTRL
jgi:hypothetical protein